MCWDPFIVKYLLIPIGIAVTLYLVRKFMNGPMCKIESDLRNKFVLITGSNSGIGLEVAKDLLKRNAMVLLLSRNKQAAQSKLQDELKSDRNLTVNAYYEDLDLSSLYSITKLVHKVKCDYPKIDILINNAGAVNNEFARTNEGIELTLGVNYFGHLVLTLLLLSRFKPQGRIINVVSYAYAFVTARFESLEEDLEFKQTEANYNGGYKSYALSKLFLVIWTLSLANFFVKNEIPLKCVSVNPGSVVTSAQGKLTAWYIRVFYVLCYPFIKFFFKDKVHGAQTTIHAAAIENVNLANGGYYEDCKLKYVSDYARDIQRRENLRRYSYSIIRRYFPYLVDKGITQYFSE